ncbi:MAG TPA: putative baseplate assembly protein [Thermoanaerobaculia bacterium]
MIAASLPSQLRDQRRKVLMENPVWKGLDFVTIDAVPVNVADGRLWRLRLHFVPAPPGSGKRPVPEALTAAQVRILLDGAPAPHVEVREILADPDPEVLTALVRTDAEESSPHDPPGHLLQLVERGDVDPLFAAAPLSFQLAGPAARMVSFQHRAAAPPPANDIDYLAKDYESFRQLMLERMAFYVPDWRERNPSDLGVTLIEVLAYAADYLSYHQDAAASEAYLETARHRISVRRHTRLLDFRLREGTNARVWVQIKVAGAAGPRPARPASLPAGTRLLTSSQRVPGCVDPASKEYRRALEEGAMVFQTLAPAALHPEHEELLIYSWGAADYTLPRGATSAALAGHYDRLQAGDVLLVEKRLGYDLDTGATPDPRERQALRLDRAPVLSRDELTGAEITEIAWHQGDALRVDFPIARMVGRVRQEGLSVVRGNLALADHGLVVEDLLATVPAGESYRPLLPRTGLTFRQPFDAAAAVGKPAAWAVEQSAEAALPDLELFELPPYAPAETAAEAIARRRPRWRPRHDLLNSGRFARDFVVEIDDRGQANLRFGDGQTGRRPPAGARFVARYRIGNGPHGNIGAHALQHVVLSPGQALDLAAGGLAVLGARNHMAGAGGTQAEAAEHAQIYAPERLRDAAAERRCVTVEDCAAMAERHPEVRRAVARRRWTGSSTLVLLYVQRRGGLRTDPAFEDRLRSFLAPCLMAGFDLAIREPYFVPLDIEITVFAQPGVREDALYAEFFGRLAAPGGELFTPEQFSFGQWFYLSGLTAAVMSIPGVADVRVDVFQRWGQPAAGELAAGYIAIGPLEIVRLDNLPAAPQQGTLRVVIEESR